MPTEVQYISKEQGVQLLNYSHTPLKGTTMKLELEAKNVGFDTNILDIKVPKQLRKKVATGIPYVDDVVGGKGFTPSAVTFFTGTPGAGKTTMMLKMADNLTSRGTLTLFNTAEESLYQVKMVAERLRLRSGFVAGQECHVPTLLANCDKLRAQNPDQPFFLIVDSLQTLDDGKYANGHTNGGSAKRALAMITEYCKANFCNAVVVGQVSKSGKFAGSNVLKHMVDTMLELTVEEKDPDLHGCRVLHCSKNRFGSAGMQIFLDIQSTGFKEVARLGIV